MSTELVVWESQDTLENWIQSLELRRQSGDISAATRNTYCIGFLVFVSWLKVKGLTEVTPKVVESWKAEMLTAHAPGTVNVWFAGVKRFYEWAVGEGLVAVNPTTGVKNVKRRGTGKRHLRDALTDHEVLRVLSQPDRTTPSGKRDYAILCLMAYCGLREVEIQRAETVDLTTDNGVLVLRVQGKGSREKDDKAVIYSPKAQDAIYDWQQVRFALCGRGPGPLFVSLSPRSRCQGITSRGIGDLIKHFRSAGITDSRKTLHSLRHSAISKVAKKDILKARQVARHTNLDTTMIYVHEADRLDNPGEQYIDYENGG